MTALEHFLLTRIFKRQVRQGPNHDKRIQYLYLMVRQAAEEEFPEDNSNTLETFLDEQFQASCLTDRRRPRLSMGDAHEIWALAQLAPGEGITDGVDRILGFFTSKRLNPN